MVQHNSKRFNRHFSRNKRTEIPYLTKRFTLSSIKEIMSGSDGEAVESDLPYEQLSSNSSASESYGSEESAEDETDRAGLLRPVPNPATPLVSLPHLFSP